MGLRFSSARVAGAVSTWGLKHVFRRPAANFPGKAGLAIDPQLIAHLRPRIREGSVVVVGTNGKTTVANVLADAFEAAGKAVACNRTGANLDSGVATALLHAHEADWGVFESDELWLAKVLPQLQPDFVVLLNLFRDQLDRAGEIDHVQQSIADALASSPRTTLVYNADDPLCQAIADAVANRHRAFGVDEDLHLPQNAVADSGVCQRCDSMLDYEWRQYGQLGRYRCPSCEFAREEPDYRAQGVTLGPSATTFAVSARAGDSRMHVRSGLPGAYMVYNLLAVCAAADCCGLPPARVAEAIERFAPGNGRLQPYRIGARRVLLNLAKNPTGFNQNLRIIANEPGPKAVAFFINDKEADGRDVSWLWDVDFQELAEGGPGAGSGNGAGPATGPGNLVAFAGGLRRNDMQVRLKYAGIDAQLVDSAGDFLAKAAAVAPDATLFLIANYTALPGVKAELDQMRDGGDLARGESPLPQRAQGNRARDLAGESLVIAHLYPELLNLYGDGGNVTILAARARARGIGVEVVRVPHGQKADLARADIVFLGGGPDREQRLASARLLGQAGALRAYVEDDGVLLAICGGFQILGREWLLGDETVPGLGIVDVTTKRAKGGSHDRIVGNVVLDSPLAHMPVVGYENHAGRTFLGARCEPFGRIVGKHGTGNNDAGGPGKGADGVLYRNVVGTYLHGPLLAKNPEVADWLIERALARRAAKEGRGALALAPLDDTAERTANEVLRSRHTATLNA